MLQLGTFIYANNNKGVIIKDKGVIIKENEVVKSDHQILTSRCLFNLTDDSISGSNMQEHDIFSGPRTLFHARFVGESFLLHGP